MRRETVTGALAALSEAPPSDGAKEPWHAHRRALPSFSHRLKANRVELALPV